jgi:tRNA (cytidine/uridine-2'-O-)-methyltransferase
VVASLEIGRHRLKVVLVWPQIPPNTGQIARLCVASGSELHLVRPMGFVLSDRQLKRAAMDYWKRLKLTVHDDLEAFLKAVGSEKVWLFENGGERNVWEEAFHEGDWLIFGSETKGLPVQLLKNWPERVLRIPQVEGERCLNLASAASIGVYEALRQIVPER